MAQATHAYRLFVRSTFRYLKEEQNVVHRIAFPSP
jgi:hypothetical protein